MYELQHPTRPERGHEYGVTVTDTSAMQAVEFVDGAFTVDAAVIAEGFDLAPAIVQRRMREGKLTSRCERGMDQDAGRYRLTFFYNRRRFHLIVDETGKVLERSDTVKAASIATVGNAGENRS
jgi:hypothetical protein